MTLRRGDSTLLDLRVNPVVNGDPVVDRWRYGRPTSYPPVPPVWPRAQVDPWELISHLGPLPGRSSANADQDCRSCGAERRAGAGYCGSCGTSFDAVELAFATRVARIADYCAAGSLEAGAEVVALVEDYTPKATRARKGWAELLEFIESDFAGLVGAYFIRGGTAAVGPGLTLASAQDIYEAVVAVGGVSSGQVQKAELLLRFAPLQFGYWGPFKALVKSVPVEDMPDAYADALARISSTDWSRPAPPSAQIEDVEILSSFVVSPSPATLCYLGRRARRDLAALAQRSPDLYARVASRMIVSWDRSLSRNAFAPAHVMLGARSPLDKHGKYVDVEPDMRSRRDAYPEIWDARPELVQRIFDTVKNSAEAHTWSYQVLESVGKAPPITADHVRLALLSTYPPMIEAACAALLSRPALRDRLERSHWFGLFRNGDDASVDAIVEAMLVGTLRPSAVTAARDVLLSSFPTSPSRKLSVSLVFLSAIRPGETKLNADAVVAATTAVIFETAVKHKKLWNPIIRQLDLEHLKRIRRAIPDDARHRSAAKVVDDHLIRAKAEAANPSEVITWIASENPVEAKLGWQMLSPGRRGYGLAWLLERLPRWIARRHPDTRTVERIFFQLLRRTIEDDIPQLDRIARAALGTGMEHASLAALLMDTEVGRAMIWRALATDPEGDVAGFASVSDDTIRAMGDSVGIQEISAATGGQPLLLSSYITANPNRISSDPDFGVAAATSTEPALQDAAIHQLEATGLMQQVWITLAKSELPKAQSAARDHVVSLRDPGGLRDAVQTCVDSESPVLRDIGIHLLRELQEETTDPSVWIALVESNNKRILELVADQALKSEQVGRHIPDDFDERVLLGSAGTRRAKESVKARLNRVSSGQLAATDNQIAVLLELARGQTVNDREWALARLAELAVAGLAINGLAVSLVTTSDD